MAKNEKHIIDPEAGERLVDDGTVRRPPTLKDPDGPIVAKAGQSIDPVRAAAVGGKDYDGPAVEPVVEKLSSRARHPEEVRLELERKERRREAARRRRQEKAAQEAEASGEEE